MAKHSISINAPGIIQGRYEGNGRQPNAALFGRCARALNHVAHYQQKAFMVHGVNLNACPDPETGFADRNAVFAFIHTGEHCTRIRCLFGLAKASHASATDPYATVRLIRYVVGTTTTSNEVHYAANDPSTALLSLSDVFHGHVDMTVDPNSDYEVTLQLWNYARHTYFTVYGMPVSPIIDDTEDGIAAPAPYVLESPIYHENIEDLLETGTNLWKHNAAPLFMFCARSNNQGIQPSTRSAGTYADDSAQSSEFQLDLAYRRTLNDANIPVRFVALASCSSGSTNGVRLVDADSETQLLEITGYDAADGTVWGSVSGTIPSTTRAVKVQRKGGSGELSLYAYGLFQYET
jgi:hypothetical protein